MSDDKSYRHFVRKATIRFFAKVFLIATACLIVAGLIIRMAGLGPPFSRGEIYGIGMICLPSETSQVAVTGL